MTPARKPGVVFAGFTLLALGYAVGAVVPSVGTRPGTEFGTQLRNVASTAWPVAILPAVVTAGFLRWRNRMASWPVASLLVAAATLVFTSSATVSSTCSAGR